MQTMREFIRDWVPPAIWRYTRRLFKVKPEGPPHYTSDRFHYPLWAIIADRLVQMKAQSVLDLGCGPGAVASVLLDRGIPQYFGIDIRRRAVQQARLLCPTYSFVEADAFSTDLIDTYPYDTFLCTEFLEHVEDDRSILLRIRPGSHVLLSVPSFKAKRHMRIFSSADEVSRRYGPCLKEHEVVSVRANEAGARFFILEGRR